MLNDATLSRVFIACGRTDLRLGIDGLAQVVRNRFHLEPTDAGTLFLFCGTRADRIKGLLWEGDGFLLLYKRLADGRFSWPRDTREAKALTPEQYRLLMHGFSIEGTVKTVRPERF